MSCTLFRRDDPHILSGENTQLSASKEVSMVLQWMMHKSIKQPQRFFLLMLEEPPYFKLGGTLCALEKQSRVGQWYLVLNVLTNTLGCQIGQPESPNTKNRHEGDGACSVTIQVLHHHRNAHMKDVSPCNWSRKLTKSKDKERYDLCWDPHTAGRNHTIYTKYHFRKHGEPLYIRAIQVHARAPNSADLFVAENHRKKKNGAKELYHIGLAKFETGI